MRTFRSELVPEPRSPIPFTTPNLPLYIEIGCGVGLHPIQFCKSNPNKYLVAIEHTRTRFEKFERRVKNHKLDNLLPVHADAVEWVTHNVFGEKVEEYFILYPNPYPKRNNQNKRWHAMPFMQKIIDTLRPEGLITIATNEKFYADEAFQFMSKTWRLETLKNEINKIPRTHFEKKYLERGQNCFNLVFKKGKQHEQV